nr:alpha/beta fold hydrolase [Fodinicola feengrottensis]
MFRVEDVVVERRGTGSPLVLLHGIGHRWQAWQPVLNLLAERHDVIAIDLPGFGGSPTLPDDRPYDMLAAVDTFCEIMAAYKLDRPHLAGNSLGGALALEVGSRGLASSVTALSPAGFFGPVGRAWAIGVLSSMRRSAMTSERNRQLMVRRKPLRLAGGSLLYGRPSLLQPRKHAGRPAGDGQRAGLRRGGAGGSLVPVPGHPADRADHRRLGHSGPHFVAPTGKSSGPPAA